jgi:hypothetical protein
LIDSATRLRVARGIAKTETAASQQVFETLKQRGHPAAPPPLISDGWGGITEAMLEVYGQVPPYKGKGRPPTRKRAQPGWQYLQLVKHRNAQGRLLNTELRVIFGQREAVIAWLGKSTAYVERTHLTMRMFNGRLTRKTLGFSKLAEMLRAAAAWEDATYNLTHAVKTLRLKATPGPRKWQPRSPALAAGLTDHIWTVKELLKAVVAPVNS